MGKLNWSVYQRPKTGEVCCGDAYLVQEHNTKVLIALIDGVEHGEETYLAATRTVAFLQLQQIEMDNSALCIQQLHKHFKSTRRIVLGLALIDYTTS